MNPQPRKPPSQSIASHTGDEPEDTGSPDDVAALRARILELEAALEKTEQRKVRRALKASEELKRRILETVPGGVVHVALDGSILTANAEAQRILGLSHDALLDRYVADFHTETLKEDMTPCPMEEYPIVRAMAEGQAQPPMTIGVRRPDGGIAWAIFRAVPVHDISSGKITGAVATFLDITDRKLMEELIRRQANYDSLTGLANRSMLRERLTLEIARVEREGGRLAVLFLDLDRVKMVNDSLGHFAGDWLLAEVAARLRQCLGSADILARQGGDEFIALAAHVNGRADVETLAAKLLAAGRRPYHFEASTIQVTASIGIAVFPEDGRDADTLLRNADAALYQVKQSGRDNFRFHEGASMPGAGGRRREIGRLLQEALEKEQFVLHYQPRARLSDGKVIAMEALIRWRPEPGVLVPPRGFIAAAEDSGLITAVGRWVLEKTAEELAQLRAAGIAPNRVALNVSYLQLMELSDSIPTILEKHGISPGQLEIEFVERTLMRDPDGVGRVLNRLHEQGISLTIDDFGVDYSSLEYLRGFPIDTIKIDRTFMNGIPGDKNDESIVAAILTLARGMGMRVTAEGVETPEQIEFLRGLECDEIQGQYLNPPIPSTEIAAYLTGAPRLT